MTCKICHGEKRVAVGWSQDLRKISGIRVEYDPCPRCTAPPHTFYAKKVAERIDAIKERDTRENQS